MINANKLVHASERVRAHPRYGMLAGIVGHCQCATTKTNNGKVLIDLFTASAAWQIVNALNEQNAIKYLNLFDQDPAYFATVTWQLVGGRSQ